MGGADRNTDNWDDNPKISEIIGHARHELETLRANHVAKESKHSSELHSSNIILGDLKKEICSASKMLVKNDNRILLMIYAATSLVVSVCSFALSYKFSLDTDAIVLVSKVLMVNVFSIAVGWPAYGLYRKMANIDIKITRKDGD